MKNLKIFFTILLLLYFPTLRSQITLSATGKDSTETNIINSLRFGTNHPNNKKLFAEIDTLLLNIQRNGFLEAKLIAVDTIEKDTYNAEFSLNKKLDKIILKYPLTKEEKKAIQRYIIKQTESGFKILVFNIETVLNTLLLLKTEKGEAFTTVYLEDIKIQDNLITAKIHATNSNNRKLDGIRIEGYKNFPKSYLRHYLKLKTGAVFNKTKLTNQTNRIKSLPFVSQIKPPEVLFTKDSTIAYLYLKKESSNEFDGFLGFSNTEKNKFVFNGLVNLKLENNLNYGEKLSIYYKSDGMEQTNFTATAQLPFLFNSPIGISSQLNIFKKDSSFLNVDQKLGVNYQINPSIEIASSFTSTNSSYLQDDNNFDIVDFKAYYIGISGSYKLQNSNLSIFPSQTEITIDLATGKRSSLNSTKQQKINIRAFHNFFISPKSSFYISNSTHFLQSSNYLENELYRFGGINSIRGFLENSIPASTLSSFQTEYRYILSSQLYAHSIFDVAYFKNPLLSQEQYIMGYGIGLGLYTKSGLLKVNLANGGFENESFNFSQSKVHLSLNVNF